MKESCFAAAILAAMTAVAGVARAQPEPAFSGPMSPAGTAKDSEPSPLPAPTGPYAVGRTSFDWTDKSRADAGNPSGHREIVVWIWYPASPKPGAEPAEWMPGKWGDFFWSDFVKTYPDAANGDKDYSIHRISTHAYPNAPVRSAPQPFPVLLFGPGGGDVPLKYASLIEDLASHGYVVVGLVPTYYSGFTELSGGRVPENRDPAQVAQGDYKALQQAMGAMSAVRVGDMVFSLNQLETLNAAQNSLFGRRLDLKRVGAFGHSFGGSTAVQIAKDDARVRAAIDIDGTLFGDAATAGPAKPLLIFNSDHAKMMGSTADPKPTGSMFAAALKNATPGYEIALADTAHYFSSDMGMMPFIPQSVRAAAKNPPPIPKPVGGHVKLGSPLRLLGSINPARALGITQAYVEAFFGQYLKGEKSALLNGPSPEYPEVSFEPGTPANLDPTKPKLPPSAPTSSAGTSDTIPVTVDAQTRKEVVEALATALADGYAHADLGRKMAQAVRAKLKAGVYNKIDLADELAHALTTDIRAIVDDKHLRVSSRPPMMMRATPGMSSMMRAMNEGIPRVEILEGNIGYMEVNGMDPLEAAKDTIAAAFAFLHNTDALIIDARANGGGDPLTVAYYMSYLSEGAPYAVNRIHYREGDRVEEIKTTDLGARSYGARKPVFFLTSRRTFSGGEEFAYDLQAFKRATIVGETTGGGANPGDVKQLGHGFSMLLPNGYVANPVTGSNWEGVGVKPDIEIPAEQALTKAKLLAVHQLQGNATDTRQQATLEELALELSEQTDGGSDDARLSWVQLAGQYGGMGPVSGPTVTERNGELYIALNTPNTPEVRLIPLGGNRYRLAGYPDDFTAFFSATNDGKVQLLASTGRGTALMQKQ